MTALDRGEHLKWWEDVREVAREPRHIPSCCSEFSREQAPCVRGHFLKIANWDVEPRKSSIFRKICCIKKKRTNKFIKVCTKNWILDIQNCIRPSFNRKLLEFLIHFNVFDYDFFLDCVYLFNFEKSALFAKEIERGINSLKLTIWKERSQILIETYRALMLSDDVLTHTKLMLANRNSQFY